MVSCGFPRSYYDEGQPAGCRHAFITDAAANGFFEHVGSGIAGHLLLATCGVSHPPAAVSDCTRCAEYSWNTIFIDWFSKSCATPPRHSRSASVGGELFVSTARPMPGRESSTGGNTKLQKGAISADVHVEQRSALTSLTREDTRTGKPIMPQKRQGGHRAGKPQDTNSPKGCQGTHRLCGQHAPNMPYGGRDPQGARVLSRSVPRRGGAQWQVLVYSGVTPWTWSHPIPSPGVRWAAVMVPSEPMGASPLACPDPMLVTSSTAIIMTILTHGRGMPLPWCSFPIVISFHVFPHALGDAIADDLTSPS